MIYRKSSIGLINFPALKRGCLLERGGGGAYLTGELNRGFTVFKVRKIEVWLIQYRQGIYG